MGASGALVPTNWPGRLDTVPTVDRAGTTVECLPENRATRVPWPWCRGSIASPIIFAFCLVLSSQFAMASSQNVTGTGEDANPVPNLYIGGFLSFATSFPSQPVVVQTAVDHINSLQGILDGYHLQMRWNWIGVRYLF